MSTMNPQIRQQIRPLFYQIMPASLSDRLLRLFSEVGMGFVVII